MSSLPGPPGPPAGVYLAPNTIGNSTATVIWTEGEAHGRPVVFHTIETCTEYNETWVITASRKYRHVLEIIIIIIMIKKL